MKKTLKALLLLLAVVFVFSTLISCNNTVDESDFGSDGYILDGEAKLRPEYVMTIGSAPVTFQEYRYHYLNTKLDYDGGNEEVWEDYPEYIPVLLNTVEESLIELYSIRSLCKEAGVESDIDAVYDTIAEYRGEMSRAEFKEGLKSFHLTEALYAYVLEGYQLYDKLFDHYFAENGEMAMSDGEVYDYADEYYYHTRHILIYPNTTMTDAEYEKHIATVLEEAQNAENFDEIIGKYSNDTAMENYGCYFTDGEKHENYENAVRELEIGEISEPILTGDGYYIIKRLPVEKEDTEVLRDIIYNRKYADMIEKRIEEIDVGYSEEYSLIAPTTVK
ncbi:MAG: peptidylprolyl isomerase [Clostridia bacterium]|nr:peptidylprolyl isomerase [Clostridia bacterium]